LDSNNYIENSNLNNATKNFDILTTNVLYNYFDSLTKLFSDLYLAKFLDTSANPFFLCSFRKTVLLLFTTLLRKKYLISRTYNVPHENNLQ